MLVIDKSAIKSVRIIPRILIDELNRIFDKPLVTTQTGGTSGGGAKLTEIGTAIIRVYREMESGKRDTQDGSRLVYVLTQIAKVLELTEIERRLILLEAKANGQLPAPAQRG